MRLFLLLLLMGFKLNAQIVPVNYQSDWNHSGLDGVFVEPTSVISITSFGAVPNDGLADDVALAVALAGLNGLTTIYFPSGTYNFSVPINLPDSVLIKGAGADSTFFDFNLADAQLNCINFIGSASAVFQPLSGGYHQGSGYVLCSNATAYFATGDYIEIRELNGSWDTNPAFWAEYAVGHLSKVTAVNADTIYLADPLRITFDSLLNPEIHAVNPVKNSGLECFRLSRNDSLAPGINYGIYTYLAWNCRIKGIESYKSIGAHLICEATAHCEIRDCFFHEAYTYDGNNTRGYGVVMSLHSSSNRIENSVFLKLRHAMMVKQGANGNVFGYNYSRETLRTEFPSNASGDISVHGHFPFANLFEGNVCQNISVDQSWGPAGPRNVFFRNRAELYGFTITSGTVQSDSQAVIGNTIPSTAPFTGFYLFNGTGHFTYGNLVQGSIQPSGTSVLPDSSCYLSGLPVFWSSGIIFPSIGAGSSGTETNPSKDRFASGQQLALCAALSTGITGVQPESEDIRVVAGAGNLKIYNLKNQTIYCHRFQLFDLSGRLIVDLRAKYLVAEGVVEIPVNFHPGVYILLLSGPDYHKNLRFSVN